jgi:predicted RNase H-like HicB family nuclease
MTDVQFTAAITHQGDWYVARCLQVEVTSQGETVESALANLREALELYFEDEPLPADVQSPIIAPVEISIRAARCRSALREPRWRGL